METKKKFRVILDQPGEIHPDAMRYLEEFAFVSIPDSFDIDELIALIQDADAIMTWGNTKLTAELLSHAGPKLRTIAVTGTGVDNVDLNFAREHGIMLTNTPGINANAVAEYTVGALLSCFRNIYPSVSMLKAEKWSEAESFTGREIKGSSIGVVGLGNIGRITARLAKAFGATVYGYDPFITEEQAEEQGIILCRDIADLGKNVDAICVHTPLLDSTYHLIGKACFDKLPEHAWIVNSSRAAVVDEDLLTEYIKAGKLAGYMTDVYPTEPPDLAKELYKLDCVYMTTHIAAMTVTAYRDMQYYAAFNIRAVLYGEPPLNII